MSNKYIYILFCADGTPFYVGQGVGDRWLDHERRVRANSKRTNPHVGIIIRQMFADGWPEIPKIKLHEGLNHEAASTYEIALITAIGRAPHGPLVNLTDGGQGGFRQSPEAVAKLSAFFKGRYLSAETRAKISASKIGVKRSAETCAKMSAAATGFRHSEESRAKISVGLTGREVSQDTRGKISVAHKGRIIRQDTRDKISATKKGCKLSDETRGRMSMSRMGRTFSEVARAKISIAAKAREARKKVQRELELTE